jgi:beta-xylosidase
MNLAHRANSELAEVAIYYQQSKMHLKRKIAMIAQITLVVLCQRFCPADELNTSCNLVWVPDNRDGTYKNPIIFADYSDPDVIRVGSDFYMTASSFNCVPGLPILQSKDLVNWKLIGHAVERFADERFNVPQHGNGVWAPAIRYHNEWFWIFYGDPDAGIFMTKAKDAAGPWETLHLVQHGKGLIDTCPFWDDDGNAYLVHAWAKSRAGINSILTIAQMSPDCTKLLDKGKIVFDGHANQPTIEGPKLYKRNGYYYIFAPAGGVRNGWQTVLRSKNIYGPYEDRIVMDQGNTNINGPHQGAWIELESEQSWFIHFQDRGAYGRIIHLQPVKWVDDWPVIGIDKDGDGKGEPAPTYNKPDVGKTYPVTIPQTSDEFDEANLGLQWQWHANYQDEWFSLEARPGRLRLFSVPLPDKVVNLWPVPNLILQKLPAPEFIVTTKLEFNNLAMGNRTGLIIMGMDYSFLAIEKTSTGYRLIKMSCKNADSGGKEIHQESADAVGDSLLLRVNVGSGAICRFSYSSDGKEFTPIGEPFTALPGKWIGAKVGLFCLAQDTTQKIGYADYDWFKFEYAL